MILRQVQRHQRPKHPDARRYRPRDVVRVQRQVPQKVIRGVHGIRGEDAPDAVLAHVEDFQIAKIEEVPRDVPTERAVRHVKGHEVPRIREEIVVDRTRERVVLEVDVREVRHLHDDAEAPNEAAVVQVQRLEARQSRQRRGEGAVQSRVRHRQPDEGGHVRNEIRECAGDVGIVIECQYLERRQFREEVEVAGCRVAGEVVVAEVEP